MEAQDVTTIGTATFRSVRAAVLAGSLILQILAPAPGRAAPTPDQMIERPAAKLQGLDKITARTSTFTLAVGETRLFGGLRITLRACRENPPIETPESAAFLEVVESQQDEELRTVFSGWMFASSPALSAMEHPIYDVWVLSCEGDEPSPKP